MPNKENGYSFVKQQARRNKKRQEAEARQREYDKMSLEQKLVQAVGKKEKAKLQKKLGKRQEKPVATPPVEVKPAKKARTPKSQVVEAAKLANPSKP